MHISKKRVLVTGGAGFIGSHLVRKLVENENEVYILDNISSGYESNILVSKSVKFYKGDVRDQELVSKLVKDIDIVFHLAEFIPNTANYGAGHVVKFSMDNPLVEFDVSCKGTLVVLESIKKYSKKLVFASTAAVYGETNEPNLKETYVTLPISPYGASKLCAEVYAQLYTRIHNLPIVIVRFFNVYGPMQRKYVMYDTLRKLAINPTELKVLGTGSEERDFIYVDDVVDALNLVAESENAIGQVLNIGCGKAISIRNLINEMVRLLPVKPIIEFTNSNWKGNVNRLCADITKIQKLGFTPKVTLHSGLNSLITWFNEFEKDLIKLNKSPKP